MLMSILQIQKNSVKKIITQKDSLWVYKASRDAKSKLAYLVVCGAVVIHRCVSQPQCSIAVHSKLSKNQMESQSL